MVELAARRLPSALDLGWLKALPPAVRFAFFGDAAARAALAPVWGSFSEEALRARTTEDRSTLWLGPDEYLLLAFAAPDSDSTPLFDASLCALGDLPHSLVNVSHRQFALEIRGEHAATILSGACPLDLDIVEFPVGMCTRTALAKADIMLWRTGESTFHLEVWRSFAGYVTGVLREIALEFYARG